MTEGATQGMQLVDSRGASQRQVATAASVLLGMSVEQMASMAKMLSASGLLPRAISTPAKAFAIIVAGQELGFPPMLALRSISLIDGKPVIAADAQLGAFKRAGGRAQFVTLTADRAELRLVHPNGDPHTEVFTEAMARDAGLLNKDNWKKHRVAMMRSRVITAGLKSVGFEQAAGTYDPDEAQHFAPSLEVEVIEGESRIVEGENGGDFPSTAQDSDGQSARESSTRETPNRSTTGTPQSTAPTSQEGNGAERVLKLRGTPITERKEDGSYSVSVARLQTAVEWATGKAEEHEKEGNADEAAKHRELARKYDAEIMRRADEVADAPEGENDSPIASGQD